MQSMALEDGILEFWITPFHELERCCERYVVIPVSYGVGEGCRLGKHRRDAFQVGKAH